MRQVPRCRPVVASTGRPSTRAATPARSTSTPSARSKPRRWTPSPSGHHLTDCFAYTDSFTDVPMLEAVGHPVAVNPDRVLNRYTREHDVEVLHFSQTVSLSSQVRDRLGAVPPRPANRPVSRRARSRCRSRRGGLVAGLARTAAAENCRAVQSRSVAAKALGRDGAERHEQCQYHELLDHGAIVTQPGWLEEDPARKSTATTPKSAGTRANPGGWDDPWARRSPEALSKDRQAQTVSRSPSAGVARGMTQLDIARASIWRIRSRVRLKCSPTLFEGPGLTSVKAKTPASVTRAHARRAERAAG